MTAGAESAGLYRRPRWDEALLASLPRRWSRVWTSRWVGRLPLVVVLVAPAALALRLTNGASPEEALAVNAGHDYIAHWLTGSPTDHYARSLGGLPQVYPVVAAALDSVGGLALVRGLSLACVGGAAVLLHATATGMFSRRAGYLAAASFAWSGPVMFAAVLGTADALALVLLAAALFLATRRTGLISAIAAGVLLAAVPVVHYSACAYVPVVLVALVATRPGRAGARVAAAVAVGIVGPLVGWTWAGGVVPLDVVASSWNGPVTSPYPSGGLGGWLVLDVGLLVAVALAGIATMLRKGWRHALVATALLAGASVVPLVQLRRGESVFFDLNLAYSTLFLALPVGVAMASLSRRTWKLLPVAPVLLLMLLVGVSRSQAMDAAWADVRPVATALFADPAPGRYFATGTAMDALKYYTRWHPDVRWVNTYDLYAQGEDATRVAVEDLHFQTLVLHTATTGSAVEDAKEAAILRTLHDNSAAYRLERTIPVRASDGRQVWLIYRQVKGAP